MKFVDGGPSRRSSGRIPIVLKKLNVEFYPEGGDLVAGLPNRVYFQVAHAAGQAGRPEGPAARGRQAAAGRRRRR